MNGLILLMNTINIYLNNIYASSESGLDCHSKMSEACRNRVNLKLN